MKKMTCKQLGGACDKEFEAETFEEIVELSKKHGAEMYQQKEPAHLKAMDEMSEIMKSPDGFNQWFEERRMEFEGL